jgi:hypothetical protein
MIMKYSFKIIRAVKRYAGHSGLMLMIPYFLQNDVDAGRLSCGSVNDFLKTSDRLIIADWVSSFKKIRMRAENILKKAQTANSVIVGVRMSPDAIEGNSYGEAVNSRSWGYTMRGLKYLIRRCGKYKAFRGLAINDYAGLERSWEFSE